MTISKLRKVRVVGSGQSGYTFRFFSAESFKKLFCIHAR